MLLPAATGSGESDFVTWRFADGAANATPPCNRTAPMATSTTTNRWNERVRFICHPPRMPTSNTEDVEGWGAPGRSDGSRRFLQRPRRHHPSPACDRQGNGLLGAAVPLTDRFAQQECRVPEPPPWKHVSSPG